MELIVGIDLGTTHSAIGVVDSGFPIVLANEEGERIVPSAVWWNEAGEVVVGQKALRMRGLKAGTLVTSAKSLIGRRASEVRDWNGDAISEGKDGLEIAGKSIEEISGEILRELKRVAEWRLGQEVKKAVITVPAYFHEGQRAATKRAAEWAGLEVVRMIHEPTAAALAYGMKKLGEKARVAVYDLGGGTFDLSVLELREELFQVLSTQGDTHLGGDQIDEALAQWVCREHGVLWDGLEPASRFRLLDEASRVKCALSEVSREVLRVPFFQENLHVECEMTREKFEKIAQPWVEKTLRLCKQAVHDAGVSAGDLQAVVLVGGSTRIPLVRRMVADWFGREVDVSEHPDEAIALGATIHAGMLSGAMRTVVLLDVTPLSLGIETLGGLMNVLIPRNTTIPCKAGEMFTNAVDGQAAMRVRVLQGEREMARDNWQLGVVDVPFTPCAKGQARVGVQFRLDENGMLEVLARDVATGRDTILEISHAAVNVSDEAVEKMVGESVEFAFDDMAERVFTEAKLKAEELLPAVDAALALGIANEEETREISLAAEEVRQSLAAHEVNALKQAVQRLDYATEALAAILVERAMDEALERKFASDS